MSWDDLEPQQVDVRKVDQKREDIDKLFFRVLSTEDGKELMEYLRTVYLEAPVATPGVKPSFAFFREGQNYVIRELEMRIRRASHG